MTSNRLLVLILAAALVAGVGVAAGTLESSVESTPDDVVRVSANGEGSSTSDDVVNVDSSTVPVGSGELAKYKRQFQSDRGKPAESGEKRSVPADGSDERDADPQAAGSGSESQGPSDGDGELRDRQRGPGEEQTSGTGEKSLLDRLLELLQALLAMLVSLLPWLAALAGVAAVVTNRDRLAALLGVERDGRDEAGKGPATHPAPANDVSRAWYELATLAGVEEVETTTPRQCAAAAVEAGADRSAVERVTRAFEEVRYAGRPVTEERRERAREGLRRAREGLGGKR